jgi:prolyl-tRNA synthetase
MKLSNGFWHTYKENPADAEIPSHQLMMRAGLIHKAAAGIYNLLPIGHRVVRKVEQIVREEMDRAGCFEVLMAVVTPGELWKETGRWDKMSGEMLKFKDKGDRYLCISPTNEEAVTDIFRKSVRSYKELPVTLYQINTKFRDEIRPRFGVMRGREFIMKDAYSFHIDKSCLDTVYDNLYRAYESCLDRIGLEFTVVEADAGTMGSAESKTHEFQALADTGEDAIIFSSDTGYAANIEKAQTKRSDIEFDKEKQELTLVDTPEKKTIQEVCDFLKKPQYHSLKSLVYTAACDDDEEIVMVMLLGDDELNEVKLKNLLNADQLLPTRDNLLEKMELKKGYIGPVGLKDPMRIIFDESIDLDSFYTVGANQFDKHKNGFCPKRDLEDYQMSDLRLAKKGDLTLDGKGKVDIRRGIEVGHIFQLGDIYSKSMGATVLGPNGKTVNPLMGCYGMGITRIVGAVIEQSHDEKGIIWPKNISPYQVHFVQIAKSDEYKAKAEEIYLELTRSGLEVIFDDRKAGPGFKFKDAELLGVPLMLTLGERDFKESGCLEITERNSGNKHSVKPEELLITIKNIWEKL